MATSRQKASTRARAAQDKRRKPSRSKPKPSKPSRPKETKRPKRSAGKGRTRPKATKRPVATKRPKATKQAQRPAKARKPSKRSPPTKRQPPTKRAKVPARAPAKARKPPKRPKAPKVPKRPKRTAHERVRSAFEKSIVRAAKKRLLVEARYRRRRGKSDLRGTVGPQRSLEVDEYWYEVHRADLEYRVEKIYRQLERDYHDVWKLGGSPTFYARLVLYTSAAFGTGKPYGYSKKVVVMGKTPATTIYLIPHKTLSAFTVEGAMHHFENKMSELDEEFDSAFGDTPEGGGVLLKHVELYAYALDPNR